MTLTQGNNSNRSRGVDPRNITDRRFITTSIGLLIEYLSAHSYDHFINPKILSSPSGKDFNNIIQFLFRQIDPNLSCPGKFEDEIISIFKFLKYPFNISKNGLSAVGSPHSWPQLLASLMWILELLEYDEEIANDAESPLNSSDFFTQAIQEAEAEAASGDIPSTAAAAAAGHGGMIEEQQTQKIFFLYLKKAYTSFLSGDDETYHRLEQQLRQYYDHKNYLYVQQMESYQRSNEQLEKEIHVVESRRLRLPQLQQKRKDYQEDQQKFEMLIEQLTKHKEMSQRKQQNRENDLEKISQQIHSLEGEIDILKDTISRQDVSPEDVKKMCEEKEHLQLSLQNTSEQLSQLQKKVWDSEVVLRDKVQNLEESVRLFNSMSEDLDYAISNAGTTPEKANIKKKIRIELDKR
jgi:kinetochore protein NDC80